MMYPRTNGVPVIARTATDPTARRAQSGARAALLTSGEALDTAARWGRQLATLLPLGHRLLIAGNGDSAAEAQHLSAEFVGRFTVDRRPFSAIALHTDTSALSAVVNDFGADEAFVRGVEAHGSPGDVLLLLSTGGRSPNLLRAVERAGQLGLRTWAMTGPPPNPLAAACQEAACVDADLTPAIQEVHLVAVHTLCSAFDEALGLEPEAGGAL
jgi:D-sedoheptulose 7-phosphate isomerase